MLAKNVVIHGIRDVSVVEREIDAENLKPYECLIETYVSLISAGTELSRVFGLKKGAVYPVNPGYCSVGKILKKGEKIYQAEEGDVVLFSGPHSSHQIYDYTASDGGILHKLNSDTTPEEGAFLMMCWIAMNGILPADVKLGDTCAVMGLGNLGLILSILYRQMGAKVISVDPMKHRCDLAREMGISHVVDCAAENQAEEIMALTDGKGVDIAVDASGLSACVETCIKVAVRYDQVILLGSPRTDYIANVTPAFNAIHTKMLTVIGALNRRYPYEEKEGSRLSSKRTMKYLEGLLHEKVIDVNKFISHIIKPTAEDLMFAYDGLMNKKDDFTGVIIDWKADVSHGT
ncbi:MAG TPA: zinc-binding alcohol dehydrogenase, partial [Clostridia bacterium]|nr:zinc-binding alcohol dehydrogenase [Clostridia bacterium]